MTTQRESSLHIIVFNRGNDKGYAGLCETIHMAVGLD